MVVFSFRVDFSIGKCLIIVEKEEGKREVFLFYLISNYGLFFMC